VVVGFGFGKRGGRGALKLLKRLPRLLWRFVLQRRVRPDVVVIVAPQCQFAAGIVQGIEQLFIEELVPQAAVEWLDKGILLRFSGVDIVPIHAVPVGPFQACPAGELRAVVTDNASGFSVDPGECVQLSGHALA